MRLPSKPKPQKNTFVFLFFSYYLISLAFEGPLRYFLAAIGIETLLYARDIIAAITVIHYIASRFSSDRDLLDAPLIFIYALTAHTVLSLWMGTPIGSVFFSLKIFLSSLYAFTVARLLYHHAQEIKLLFLSIFSLSAAGVIINYFNGPFPWEGDIFDTAFGSVKTTKVWWAGGERRLPGFSRASFSAAMAIGITGAYIMGTAKHLSVRLLVFTIGLTTIYLTTSKGMIIAYGICGSWLIFTSDTNQSQRAGIKLLTALSIAVVLIPVISDLYDGNPADIRKAPPLLTSFWDRISESWPQTFAQLQKNYGYILGKGLGGVGIAIRISEGNTNQFVPIDNIFWYIYSIFGIASLIYWKHAINRIWSLPKSNPTEARPFIALSIIMAGYGLTSVMFEDPFFSITFGLLIGWPSESKKAK